MNVSLLYCTRHEVQLLSLPTILLLQDVLESRTGWMLCVLQKSYIRLLYFLSFLSERHYSNIHVNEIEDGRQNLAVS